MEKQNCILDVINYSKSPGPRYVNQGDDSGEDFYHKTLNGEFYTAISDGNMLEVNLDGPDGYASSFLDEAFGNLVFDFGLDCVKNNVTIISNEEPEWIDMLTEETYLEWEKRRKKGENPTKTTEHPAWYKRNGENIINDVWLHSSVH